MIFKFTSEYLGKIEYRKAWDLQKRYHSEIVDGKRQSTLLLLEHTPVITLGKNATPNNLLCKEEELLKEGIDYEHVDRGGEITAHEPGQLIIYPLIHLKNYGFGPKLFVHTLEESILKVLKDFSIDAERHSEYPGVWVSGKKICSVGIRILRKVSYHGLALNVSNDLEIFRKIIPCGLEDKKMTSLSEVLGYKVESKALLKSYEHHFQKAFESVLGEKFSQRA